MASSSLETESVHLLFANSVRRHVAVTRVLHLGERILSSVDLDRDRLFLLLPPPHRGDTVRCQVQTEASTSPTTSFTSCRARALVQALLPAGLTSASMFAKHITDCTVQLQFLEPIFSVSSNSNLFF